jgi:hypothetical protein
VSAKCSKVRYPKRILTPEDVSKALRLGPTWHWKFKTTDYKNLDWILPFKNPSLDLSYSDVRVLSKYLHIITVLNLSNSHVNDVTSLSYRSGRFHTLDLSYTLVENVTSLSYLSGTEVTDVNSLSGGCVTNLILVTHVSMLGGGLYTLETIIFLYTRVWCNTEIYI